MEIPEKIYRNIQQQVAKNQCDIRVLKYGLKIIGTTLDVDGLTSIPALEGESALVGEPGKQKVYIFLDNKWKYVTDLASDVPGPKGDKGATGETGERGSYWFFGYHEPDLGMDPKEKDMYLNGLTGDVYQFNGKDWGRSPLARIIGPQGIQGPRGYQGDVGPQGPKGDKGDVGFTFVIRGKVASEDLLPDINSLPANSGYLVGETDVSLYIVQIDPTTLNRTWLNVGVLLSTNAVAIAYDNASSGLTATNLQASTDELAKDKLNKDALQWTTLPEGAVDKKTFYNKTISTLRTANNKIYMFGTPEETPIKEFFDIWEKPTDFKATHVYIVIESISNTASRDSFKMTIHSSNYGNMYYMVVNGYSSQLVGTSGWISYNLLNADRQNKLAKNDGSYIKMTVGNAEGLIDPQDKDTPTQVNQDFSSRVTANGATIKGSSPDTKASLLSVKGETFALNQLAKVKVRTENKNGIIVTASSDGTITLNGTQDGTVNETIIYIDNPSITMNTYANHKYFSYYLDAPINGLTFSNRGSGSFSSNGLSNIFSNSVNANNIKLMMKVAKNTTFNNDKILPLFTDLTQCFGIGNEPTSVDDPRIKWLKNFLIKKPKYNTGDLYSSKPISLTSYGENLFDNIFEIGYIGEADGIPYEGDGKQIRSVNYQRVFALNQLYLKSLTPDTFIRVYLYDKDKTFLLSTGASEGKITLDTQLANAYYYKIAIYYNDGTTVAPIDLKVNVLTQFNNSDTYIPYVEPDIVEIPNVGGLNGVGSVHDEITKEKYIKRFGEVDLSTLEWSYYSDGVFSGKLGDLRKNGEAVISKYYVKGNPYENNDLTYDAQMTHNKQTINIRDNNLNGDVSALTNKLNGVILRYELATPVITTHKLDFEYNAYIGGIEAWTNDGTNPLADFHYYMNLLEKVVTVRSRKEQEDIDNTQDSRIQQLEEGVTHLLTDTHDLIDFKADKDKTMAKHKYIGDIWTVELYNQLYLVDAIANGELFTVEISHETPTEALGRGFPYLQAQSVIYGWFSKDELGDVMILLTEQGLFKVIDGTSLSCSKIGATEELPLNFTRLGKNYKVQLDTTAVNSVKKLKVWYEFYFLVSGSNILHCRCDEIEFTSKSNADVYIGMIMPSPNALSVDLALVYNKASGVLQISTSSSGAVIPDNIKIVDVKGVR